MDIYRESPKVSLIDSGIFMALHSGTLFSSPYILDPKIDTKIENGIILDSTNMANRVISYHTFLEKERDQHVSAPSSSAFLKGCEILEEYPEVTSSRKSNVTGPEGALKGEIEKVLERPKPKARKRKPAKTRVAEFKARVKRYEDKSPSEYHTQDMYMFFKELWADSGFSSTYARWLKKDFANMKRLIDEQGAAAVVTYIKYVFANWNDLKSTGKNAMGVPTVSILWGFRSSWLEDALRGASAKRKGVIRAEWTEMQPGDDEFF
jgi:hypothetical protein